MKDFINEAHMLYEKWVSFDKKIDIDRIEQSIRSEIAANRKHPARCSDACKRETRGDAIKLGKIKAQAKRENFIFGWNEKTNKIDSDTLI